MATKITNVKSFEYNSVAYLGNMEVSWEDGIDDIVRNKFDNDLGATAGKAVNASVTGTITGVDWKVYWAIPKGDTQTLVFTGCPVDGGTDITVTITTTMMLKLSSGLSHADDSTASITFEAFYAVDGATSPVVITQV